MTEFSRYFSLSLVLFVFTWKGFYSFTGKGFHRERLLPGKTEEFLKKSQFVPVIIILSKVVLRLELFKQQITH